MPKTSRLKSHTADALRVSTHAATMPPAYGKKARASKSEDPPRTKRLDDGVPDALKNFGSLPDEAHVRQPVVEALYACSAATVWRRVKNGLIPSPAKFSNGHTAWNVGKLRAALRGAHE